MEIDIIPTEQKHLKKLLDFLNENVYSKMKAKDVDELKALSGKTSLMKAIREYYISQRCIDLKETWDNHSDAMQRKEKIIWRLEHDGREQTEAEKHGYGKGRYMGD